MRSLLNKHTRGIFAKTGMIALMLMAIWFLPNMTYAQGVMPGEDKPVDAKLQLEIIDSVMQAINEIYVFPDVAAEMDKFVREQYQEGAYKDIETISEFAARLTEDLRSICHDRHLGIRFASDETIADLEKRRTQEPTPEDLERMRKMHAFVNYDFKKLEIMDGNVGYLRFDGFDGSIWSGPTGIAAMNFLANCDAIIIDMRYNGGGSPNMIQLITSYFFEEPTHLNSFYIRKEDTIRQFWTQAYVEGPRLTDVDLYVLTSNNTFSAAEEFTYNLKNLKRATIVGETTGGGAHPVESHYFANENIQMRVPFGKAINPITGTNWEGTGVEPDVKVPADKALETAYLDALKKNKAKYDDDDYLARFDWAIAGLESELNPVMLEKKKLKDFVGQYGPRKITLKDDNLVYQREDREPMQLIPMGDDMFKVKELEYFRVKFARNDKGKVVRINGLYDNGYVDGNDRD